MLRLAAVSSLIATALAVAAVPATAQGDPATCQGLPATIAGTPGDDVLKGTEGRDVIVGGGGDDTINSLGGDDVICADEPDFAPGTPGDDRVNAGPGADVVAGGDGVDVINGGGSEPGTGDSLDGGRGNDRIVDRGDGDAYISTGHGNNTVVVDVTGELDLDASDGDDTVNVTAGGDLNGDLGTGSDHLVADVGGNVNANLSEGLGSNLVSALIAVPVEDDFASLRAAGTINLRTGGGSSTVHALAFTTLNFAGGFGADTVIDHVRDGDVNASLGGGADTVRAIPGAAHGQVNISAGDGNDVIILPDSGPGAGDASIDAGAGNDSVTSATRTNYLAGGAGDDRLVGGDGEDYLTGDGSGDDDGDDTLIGRSGADWFDAGGGDDKLYARDAAADNLFACGPGRDTLRADADEDDQVPRTMCGEARFSVAVDGRTITTLNPATSVATFVLPPGADAASEWLTVAVPGSLTRKVSRQADLPLADAPSEGIPQVTVDTSQTRQTMEGFGGAMTQSAAWLLQQQTLAQRKAMLNALFSPGKAALNFVRVPLGASDLSTEDYDYDPLPFFESTDTDLSHFSVAHDDADLVPTLQQAKQINTSIKLMGTPWSAPDWMKMTSDCDGSPYLDQDNYEVYANYLLRAAQAYRDRGLTFDVLSLQNEPHNCKSDFPTMKMEPGDQAHLARLLRPRLDGGGFAATSILGWDHNYDDRGGEARFPVEAFEAAGGTPQAAGAINAIGYHCYDGKPQSTMHDLYPSADIYFTECTGLSEYGDPAVNLVNETRDQLIGPIRNWARTSLYWSLVLGSDGGPNLGGDSCTTCRGMLEVDRDAGTWAPSQDYYYWSQFSRFVQRGATVIQTSDPADGDLLSTAFRNPDGTIVVVVLNASDG